MSAPDEYDPFDPEDHDFDPKVIAAQHRAERRVTAIRMRHVGATYQAIAEQLGVSVPTAVRDVQAGLKEIMKEPAEEMIANQRVAIRDMRKALYVAMLGGDKDAISSMLKALDHEAKLFGLYAPARVNVGVNDEEFALTAVKLMREIGITPPAQLQAKVTAEMGQILDGELAVDEGVTDLATTRPGERDPWVT